jgi:thymidylate synthase
MSKKNIEQQYLNLLQKILYEGERREDRTGVGTISVFGGELEHDFQLGFPLLTTKKMSLKSIFTELKWFLKGDTNIRFLVQNGCNIWNGDCYKHYAAKTSMDVDGQLTMEEFVKEIKTNETFAEKWGELGKIYGFQWIKSNQLKNVVNELKRNPHSRRHLVMSWDVEDIPYSVLPPCHFGFQLYVDSNGVSLKFFMRSSDIPLGLPYNIASYSMLLVMIANQLDLKVHKLYVSLGDSHIYINQLEGVVTQLNRNPLQSPHLNILTKRENLEDFEFEDFELLDYNHHSEIKFPLSN